MSFFYNSRAVFPSPLGPTLFYSSPYASAPLGWNTLAYGPSCGTSSRALWGRPRAHVLASPRRFEDTFDDPFEDFFDALGSFPQSKYSRPERSSDVDDSMDLEENCRCGDKQLGDCGDKCEKDTNKGQDSPNIKSTSERRDDKASLDDKSATRSSESAIEKSNSSLGKFGGFSGQLLKNFYADEQKFKVDETDELVTVTSTWNGFNKADLNVDFKNGALLVSGKSEVETKDERTGAVSKSYKSVSKTIRLPENIDKEGIRAKYKDDSASLTITVPKVKNPEIKPDPIVIN